MESVVTYDRAARLQDNANLIWGAAERMRGKITPADYGKVILPFTVLRRMDCLLAPHIKTIQALAAGLSSATDEARAQIIRLKTGLAFYGLSDFTLAALLADPEEVIRLMTSLLFAKDGDKLASEASAINILDPACGTGGMLATANDYLRETNANLRVNLFGQEVNPESFAICRSDMLLTGHSPDNIQIGNTLNDDQFHGQSYSYCLSNPPYGVDYGEEYEAVKAEHEDGDGGRFAPGIPRKSDGQLLFLLHMISKLPRDRPGRIAVIMNGSPLFNGDAGGGESEIRRFLMEGDRVDAIIALPTDLFYNTGIATYIWIVTNRKATEDRGKVRLIDASSRWAPMRKSLGSKRRELTDADIEHIANLYLGHEQDDTVKVFAPEDFGYRKIFIERPLRLDVDLSEAEPGRFRNASDLDNYFLWMAETFGEDCGQHLGEIKAEVTEHIEEEEGLALLRADENAARAEVAAAQKRCKRLLKTLLDADEHTERRTLIGLIRGLREQGQSTWMDYNAFVTALTQYAKVQSEKLTAARLKVIRVWVTETNPEAERVIDKEVTGKQDSDERFGFFPAGKKVVSYERDSDLADTERVPLDRDIIDYFEAEVLPHVEDAWINPDKCDGRDGEVGIVGYEINFNRYFYQYVPPRPLAEIDAELKAVEQEIADLLAQVAE